MENGKRNGYFAGIAALVAVLSVVAGQINPIAQNIEFIDRRQSELKTQVSNDLTKLESQLLDDIKLLRADMNVLEGRERAADEKLASFVEIFREVETQFQGARDLSEQRFSAVEFRVAQQERDGNPRHDERIKFMESQIEKLNGE